MGFLGRVVLQLGDASKAEIMRMIMQMESLEFGEGWLTVVTKVTNEITDLCSQPCVHGMYR